MEIKKLTFTIVLRGEISHCITILAKKSEIDKIKTKMEEEIAKIFDGIRKVELIEEDTEIYEKVEEIELTVRCSKSPKEHGEMNGYTFCGKCGELTEVKIIKNN